MNKVEELCILIVRDNALVDAYSRRLFLHATRNGQNNCLEWTRCVNSKGYGRIDNIMVHRLAFLLKTKRPIPDGMLVCHRCDNPRCINVDHLFLGTAKDNTADMFQKGRHGRRENWGGEKIGTHKLTWEQVHWIRQSTKSGRELARLLNISRHAVMAARKYKSWRLSVELPR